MKTTNTAKYIPGSITIRTFEPIEGEGGVGLNWVWDQAQWDGEKHIVPENVQTVKGIPAFPIDSEQKRSSSFNNWIPYNKFHADTSKPIEITFENTPKDGYRVVDMSWRKDDIAWRVLSADGRIYDLRNGTFTELFFRGKVRQDRTIEPKLQFVRNGSQMRLEDTTSHRYTQYLTTADRATAQVENKELRKQHEKDRRALRVRPKDLVVGRIYSQNFDVLKPTLYLGKDSHDHQMWLYLLPAPYGTDWVYFHNIGKKFRTTDGREEILTQELFFELLEASIVEELEKLTNLSDLRKKSPLGPLNPYRPSLPRNTAEFLRGFSTDEVARPKNVWPAQKVLYDIPTEQLEKFRKFFEEANAMR